jgi:geranylgeranyl pyrophosphate synthase
MDFTAELQLYRRQVERGIDDLVPPAATRPSRLHEAMRYSLQAGGKRLRPVLTLAASDVFRPPAAGDAPGPALPAAVAIECVHTYSLIHDDLPCMDNDDLRRGRPTAHRQYDEATALLAGDALLTLAFQLIARHYAAAPALCAALTRELAEAAGSERLIGGQMEDLQAEKRPHATAADLESIHLNKTAAMIAAAFVSGGLCGGADEAQLAVLRRAGRRVGLAFQIVDDILDATADTATLGKTAGKDARAGKVTFLRLHGLEESRRRAAGESEAALAELGSLPAGAPFLSALVRDMAGRVN